MSYWSDMNHTSIREYVFFLILLLLELNRIANSCSCWSAACTFALHRSFLLKFCGKEKQGWIGLSPSLPMNHPFYWARFEWYSWIKIFNMFWSIIIKFQLLIGVVLAVLSQSQLSITFCLVTRHLGISQNLIELGAEFLVGGVHPVWQPKSCKTGDRESRLDEKAWNIWFLSYRW